MKRVIVDGYNLAHKLGRKLSPQTLASVRQELEQKLKEYATKYRTKVTVVYDGQWVLGQSQMSEGLEVIFTASGESADKCIKELIDRNAHSRANLTVVSSDWSIRKYAKVSGIESQSSEGFLEALQNLMHQSERPSSLAPQQEMQETKPKELSEAEVEEWKKLFGA